MGGRSLIIDDVQIEENKILRTTTRLQDNKAGGVDELNSTFIKGCIPGLLKPLTILYRESIITGIIPKEWKEANVTAIFKKGSKKTRAITDQLVSPV